MRGKTNHSNPIKIITGKTNPKKRKSGNTKIAVKLFLILVFVFGLYYYTLPYTNSINLLAVNENQNGNVRDGSIVKLTLTTKPGSGNIYINLNTIGETDTQISIINSQKIACSLFELDCSKYDFFYEFSDNDAIVLKGPSGSSAIAILVSKNLNREHVPEDVTITGSLNAGGLIGIVGGIDEKILAAQKNGFSKVLVPIFAEHNQTYDNYSIEVIEVIDIVNAYNQFSEREYELEKITINNTRYSALMKDLAQSMCARTQDLKQRVNEEIISTNSTEENYLLGAQRSFNSSQKAFESESYYSSGSFCFNSNINYRTIISFQENLTPKERDEKIEALKKSIDEKRNQIHSPWYKQNIQTINDFYVYLIINDRIDESKELLESLDSLDQYINSTENQSINTTGIKIQKDVAYSYALERLNTVTMWENFIVHSGENIHFSDARVDFACSQINRQIVLKSELLGTYGISFLNDEISQQLSFEASSANKYLCIYQGLELEARINTILSSAGITNQELENYSRQVATFTTTRVNLNSQGHFPLIPTIYSEYSKELLNQNDYSSSLLYSNFALSYSDLNLYLEDEIGNLGYANQVFMQLFSNIIFVLGILLLIAFI